MIRPFVFAIAACFGFILSVGMMSSYALAKTTFVTIGTGGLTGVYYPTGNAISEIINEKSDVYGIRCTAESTSGSVFNINAVISGDLDFGIVQSDRQYQAWKGLAEWKNRGCQEAIRAVFSMHPESVTLVAALDSGIRTIQDLRGKRVNIGNPGSGQRQNSIDAMTAAGIDYKKDLFPEGVKAAEAPGLLKDGRIDAFFYTVGHPSGTVKEATAGKRKVCIIPLTDIQALLTASPYYAPATIPVEFYPGAANNEDVPTFGVRASLITSVKAAEEVVYAITKEVFDNLEHFKGLHPAYQVLTREGMLIGMSAPIHPGAMKYYREQGLVK
ncbi:MAG: TAXI family TRAP transporter solute-binding subunit [Thermodesulfobacteriota bacterium]|nr:TAXI family TRAP transporter solute-binding subunit [Thermodesulfobacteriota bacterium]